MLRSDTVRAAYLGSEAVVAGGEEQALPLPEEVIEPA
jgi:hypothetical protein